MSVSVNPGNGSRVETLGQIEGAEGTPTQSEMCWQLAEDVHGLRVISVRSGSNDMSRGQCIMGVGWCRTEVWLVAGTSACMDCNACGRCWNGVGGIGICVGIGSVNSRACGTLHGTDMRGMECWYARVNFEQGRMTAECEGMCKLLAAGA